MHPPYHRCLIPNPTHGFPSFPQVVTSSLLDQWGLEGFHSHVSEVEDFYRKRRDTMVAAADKHLTGLVEYNVPLGGMFLWMKVHLAPSALAPLTRTSGDVGTLQHM